MKGNGAHLRSRAARRLGVVRHSAAVGDVVRLLVVAVERADTLTRPQHVRRPASTQILKVPMFGFCRPVRLRDAGRVRRLKAVGSPWRLRYLGTLTVPALLECRGTWTPQQMVTGRASACLSRRKRFEPRAQTPNSSSGSTNLLIFRVRKRQRITVTTTGAQSTTNPTGILVQHARGCGAVR